MIRLNRVAVWRLVELQTAADGFADGGRDPWI